MYKAILFDMDGTLLDTIEDLTNALNYAMKKCDHRHNYTCDEVKYFFGSGVSIAIKRALNYENDMPLFDLLLDKLNHYNDEIIVENVFREYYKNHCNISTKVFNGIYNLLKTLKDNDIKICVISNKQNDALLTLTDKFFNNIFTISLGQKEGIPTKPNPAMINYCIDTLNVKKDEVLYIGDSEIDALTSINANVDGLLVDWGFRDKEYLENNFNINVVSTIEEIDKFIKNKK